MSRMYSGTTRTLELDNTSYRSVIFQPSKPPLDSELNFLGDLPHELDVLQIQQAYNSGWYPVFGADTKGYDNTGETYCINFTDTSNQIIIKNLQNQTFQVNVFGETVQVGGTNSTDDSQLIITLPPPPSSGTREDLVFLEVWYQEVDSQSTNYKPSSSTVYGYGNTQYGGTDPQDNMYYSPVGTTTTNRVQLQYQIRVVAGANFINYPDGVNDPGSVFAQTNNASPTAYTYTRHPTDTTLYVAGDGSPTAETTLATVDGYAYAIPMFRIHRRNTGSFSLGNLNGAGKSIVQGNSDRPDGFFNDKIELSDLEDLRYFVAVAPNYDAMLYGAFHQLLSNQLNTILTESDLGSDVRGNGLMLQIDGMSVVDQTGVRLIAQPNSQRSVISDALSTQRTIQQINLANRTQVFGINWTVGDEFIVNLVGSNPDGTVFGSRTPSVYAVIRVSGVETVAEMGVSVTPLGQTTLVFTITSVPNNVTNQTLNADFDISYPAGNGLSFVPENVVEVYEVRDNLQYSFVSDTDVDGIRLKSLVTSASAVDVLIGLNPQWAFTTEGFIVLTGNGTQQYTVGPTWGGVPITHVYYVAVNNLVVTRTSAPLNISQIQVNGDNSISILFNQAIPVGTSIQVAVGLANNAVSFQKKTKSITAMSTIQILSKTILAGQNVTQIAFQANGLVYSAQSELSGLNTYQSIVYLNNIATPCTTTIDGSFVVVTLTSPVGVSQNTTVNLVVNVSLALATTQRLQVFYQFVPYQGVTARLSFGTGANAQVETRIIAKADGMLVHTSGTNGLSRTVPEIYSPISVKLPLPFTGSDSDLDNSPLGAYIFPTFKGLSLTSDFTIGQVFAPNGFESLQGWSTSGSDTTGFNIDNGRKMFDQPTLRFNKTGVSGVLAILQRAPYNTDWSTIIDNSGNLLNANELVYWFYLPDSSVVQNVQLALDTSGGSHFYQSTTFVTGWNKASFVARTSGTATTSTITNVRVIVSVNIPATTQYGFAIVTPYIEAVNSSVALNDGDVFFAQSENLLYQFYLLQGMTQYLSDGFLFWKDREYTFGDPVVAGINSAISTKVTPPALLGQNFVSNVGGNNDRGTPNGSLYYSTGQDTLAQVNKQAVVYQLEQVVNDQTGNFAQGEFLLRVETNMSTGTAVEVSNNDFTSTNSIDVFRLPLRLVSKPLV